LVNKSLGDHIEDIERFSGTFIRELIDELEYQFRQFEQEK